MPQDPQLRARIQREELERLLVAPPSSGPRQPLPTTPLAETNPWLARIRDFLGGAGGWRDGLDPKESTSTAVGQLAGELNPMHLLPALGGVTTFLKNGVPDKAARLANTTETMRGIGKTLRQLGVGYEEGIKPALQLAREYPRVAAHTSVAPMPEIVQSFYPSTMGMTTEAEKAVPGRTGIWLGQGSTIGSNPDRTASGVLAHEFVHAGQNVGLKEQYWPAYEAETNAVGYRRNKYEDSANRGAADRGFATRENTDPKIYQALPDHLKAPAMSKAAWREYHDTMEASYPWTAQFRDVFGPIASGPPNPAAYQQAFDRLSDLRAKISSSLPAPRNSPTASIEDAWQTWQDAVTAELRRQVKPKR